MPPDDPDLIDAFRQGDEFAFVALYDRYKGAVYAYCARMLLDRTQAEDMLQETFARAYEHRDRLLNSTSFKAWLFTIARNQCLNALRKRGREVPFALDAPEPPARGATPFANLLKSEQADLVQKTLAALPPSYREVVVLREYQNLSYDEIAAVTRTTVSSVKSRLFKARRKIGHTLRPWLHPEETGPSAEAAAPAVAARPA
jgi:RNA polymerase sigma-70 factor (ECF subfamily)